MNKEFFEAVKMLEKEKGVSAAALYEKIAAALVTAIKRNFGGRDIISCRIEPENFALSVNLIKTVVETQEDVMDADEEIALEDAALINENAAVGDKVEVPLEIKKFGYIAAQTAKHVIRQGIRDAEKAKLFEEFQSRNQDIVTVTVLRVDPRSEHATVELGKSEAILLKSEQMPTDDLRDGDRVKVYISEVRESEKGPKAMISRIHPGLVRRLFELEVPEIEEGIVEIRSISREAGARTKIAVSSKDENVDPVGACIGVRHARVKNIVEQLGGEKIDIIKFSEDPSEFVAEALKPAEVISVVVDPDGKKECHALVPESQLSLAIGNKGQNARLAARLTGWKIDIQPESGYFE
jgi:N utilization substance protein A